MSFDIGGGCDSDGAGPRVFVMKLFYAKHSTNKIAILLPHINGCCKPDSIYIYIHHFIVIIVNKHCLIQPACAGYFVSFIHLIWSVVVLLISL